MGIKQTRRCPVCMKFFKTPYSRTYICSDFCKTQDYREKTGRLSYQNKLPSGTVGAISEMAIAIDLMSKGYSVFRALSQASKEDLIIKRGQEVVSVECRTGSMNSSGNINFPKRKDDCPDMYAVYIPRTGTCLYYENDAKTPLEISNPFPEDED